MKGTEVHSLEDAQLVEQVGRAREEVFNLRVRHATGQLENTAGLRRARKDLARGLTVAVQRGIDVDLELRRQADD